MSVSCRASSVKAVEQSPCQCLCWAIFCHYRDGETFQGSAKGSSSIWLMTVLGQIIKLRGMDTFRKISQKAFSNERTVILNKLLMD